MKKQFLVLTLAALLAGSLLPGCAAPRQEMPAAAMPTAVSAPDAAAAEALITEAAAKRAALTHAGLKEADVSFVQVKLDRDNGRTEYEIEFYSADREYDYEIDAITGEILACDYEAEHYDRPAAAPTAAVSDTDKAGVTGDAKITEDEARAIALKNAGLSEADVTALRVHLDRDDGRTVYEVEFDVGQTEYSYEIDAASGRILDHEAERDD